ncbi:hypothetical protein AOU00_00075 [Paenibacillus polymyxa]|nr:hypothetical protein AOU00_00075 [Paenibacillus polymyxa]
MDSHLKPCVTILGSGNSLGVYMPAVQLAFTWSVRHFKRSLCARNVYVDGLKNKVPAYRKAFHDNFVSLGRVWSWLAIFQIAWIPPRYSCCWKLVP